MPLSVRQVRTALRHKLGFSEDQADHRRYVRTHGGRIVGITYLSHKAGGKDVGDGLLSTMAQQLKVSPREFKGGVDCRVSSEAFLGKLLQGRARE